MIQCFDTGVFLHDGQLCDTAPIPAGEARQNTMAWRILQAHNTSADPMELKIRFDAMVSHDITYVGIIQQARASGMKEFPIPYALTNCHNSLCAVGGTINEDDHMFGLSAARKYGGIYVPANQSVIHSYAREEMAGCGKMILGSDSHTRYGALGTMAVGEGGPELAKQLLRNTWDIPMPKVVLVYLTGKPQKGVGPHDVAIALVKATFDSGFVNNCVLEFCGPGIEALPMDYRNGVDVMTTETTCLSSIWETDETTRRFFRTHGREEDYKSLHPGRTVYYDKYITIELAKVEPIVRLVAEASEKGLNADGSMTHEANLDTGHVDDDRHWWVQAEAVVGFYNIYQHFGDAEALDKALGCWQYIKQNLIDHERGEWFWSRDRNGLLNLKDDHAGFWKCPYHNSRMCLELIERIGEAAS